MIKENISVYRKLLWLFDLLIVSGAFCLAFLVRSIFPGFAAFDFYLQFLPVMLFIWGGLLHYFGMYESFRTMRIPRLVLLVLKITLFAFVAFNTFAYVLKWWHLSRAFIGLAFGLSALFISAQRVIIIIFFRQVRKFGYNYRNILIVGTGKRAQHFIEVADAHQEWGFRIVGMIDDEKERVGQVVRGYPVIGTFQDIEEITNKNVIDEVVFIVPRSWLTRIEGLMNFCETKGLRMHLAVDHFELKLSRVKQTELNGFPILTFETTPDKIWHLLVKRLMDIIISGAALVIFFPLLVLIALLVKLTSRGPVFFRQTRCGLNGRSFTLYKFRTMSVDAEEKLNGLLAHNEMRWPAFKMKNDPRLTMAGRLLRKLSLDELPQLYNVFKGNMSIVGPRPPIPREVNEYDAWHRRRLSMRPGITCLWQVNGRNNIPDFNKWVELDLAYIDNWSLWLDCKIMLRTLPVVLTGSGAR